MGKPKTKINVKDRIEDDTIDLSLSEISEIPVKDIAMYKRCTILDLSSNKIGALGKNFTTLNHLTKLDLSKNAIKILPEDFGKFINLRHLDLYDNHLEHLPLSFGTLKKLRYLDLKGNPLMPTLAKFVGPCITTKDCQQSAINTVKFLTEIQIRVNEERKVAAALKQQQEQEDLLKTENKDNENIIEQSEEVKVEDPSTIKPKKVKKKKLDKNNEDNENKNGQQLSKNNAIENIKRTNNEYSSIKNLFKFLIFTILFMFSILLFFTIFIIKFPVYTDVIVKKLPTNYQTIFVDVMQQFKKKVAHLIKLN